MPIARVFCKPVICLSFLFASGSANGRCSTNATHNCWQVSQINQRCTSLSLRNVCWRVQQRSTTVTTTCVAYRPTLHVGIFAPRFLTYEARSATGKLECDAIMYYSTVQACWKSTVVARPLVKTRVTRRKASLYYCIAQTCPNSSDVAC